MVITIAKSLAIAIYFHVRASNAKLIKCQITESAAKGKGQ